MIKEGFFLKKEEWLKSQEVLVPSVDYVFEKCVSCWW